MSDSVDRDNPANLAKNALSVFLRKSHWYDASFFERADAEHMARQYYGASLYTLVSNSDWNPIAYDACVLLFEKSINEREFVSPTISAFVIDVLRQKRSRPKIQGPNPYKNANRNFAIRVAVQLIDEQFPEIPQYDAYDNGKENACAIVSGALKEFGIHLTSDAIKKIWLRKGPVATPSEAEDDGEELEAFFVP